MAEVEDSVKFADESPKPEMSQLLENVFADPKGFGVAPDGRYRCGLGGSREGFEGFDCWKGAGWLHLVLAAHAASLTDQPTKPTTPPTKSFSQVRAARLHHRHRPGLVSCLTIRSQRSDPSLTLETEKNFHGFLLCGSAALG
jgi:hypothetical protein